MLVSLKSLLRRAQRRGDVSQNVAETVTIEIGKRDQRKLVVGRDIPLPGEIKAIVGAAAGKWRVLLVVAAVTGLRSSELRGLVWADVDLKKGELHVRQRADRYNVIGSPKSHAGERTIPLGPYTLNTLREWKLACPKSDAGLVFPTSHGRIYNHKNILRALAPIMARAGVTDKASKPKYALHALRHFNASWLINAVKDGGLGLSPKVVQTRLGHATLALTMDTYSHLFPRGDDGSELAAAERALLS